MTSSLKSRLEKDGYVVIPALLTVTFLSSLREACVHTQTLASAGQWPHLRTIPKQFPPWPSDPSLGIWGIQHLLHPSLPAHALFAESYFSPAITDVVKELLACSSDNSNDSNDNDDGLVMELYNLLVTPPRDFALRWHRDDIHPSASPEEEHALLAALALARHTHAQWNLALYDDASLIVVPGSHSRARYPVERMAGPYERDMPGQEVVRLKAGDTVFYDNNILHRGVYRADVLRMTLHGSMGHVRGGRARARNVLQHGVGEWVGDLRFEGLGEEVGRRAEGMRRRLVELGRRAGNVGFSQED
ncbi:hypothetical protein MMC14_010250 [Varicellaria rhodocarpa]|nr:hypothetical protein [Varicellaria rhodocarpa]